MEKFGKVLLCRGGYWLFLELSRRHAPGGEQLHGRPLLRLSD